MKTASQFAKPFKELRDALLPAKDDQSVTCRLFPTLPGTHVGRLLLGVGRATVPAAILRAAPAAARVAGAAPGALRRKTALAPVPPVFPPPLPPAPKG
jgi:hypothetical protein